MKNPSPVTEPALSFSKGHSPLSLKAPAKINLFLRVFGRRCDGYHEIKSLIQKINLHDVLTFTLSDNLKVTTSFSDAGQFVVDLPAGQAGSTLREDIPEEHNLVYKAAVLLRNKCSVKSGAKINLNKKIPLSAGLGGGSSDAASALLGLNKIWSLGLSNGDLYEFAEQLGADVPFFLNGPRAFVEGKGEKITNIEAGNSFHILLVKPHITVSTAWVYNSYQLLVASNELKDNNTTQDFELNSSLVTHHSSRSLRWLTNEVNKVDNITLFIKAVEKAELRKSKEIFNDLEAVTIKSFPVIADIKDRLIGEGAIFSLMSGSGPTVFGIFNSAEEAMDASKAFKDYWTAVVKTLTD
ncbi:MAG: 4-(cytidine 5'-diphospho)-2-C-methyl-D-erythritol kinase [Nitrospirota bacterium]